VSATHEATIRTSDEQSIVPIKHTSGDEGTGGVADASKRKADSTEDLAASGFQRKKIPRAGNSNYSLPLSLQWLMYIYAPSPLSLPVFLDKFKEPELAINESEKLWLDVARTISTFQAEASTTSIREKQMTACSMLDDRSMYQNMWMLQECIYILRKWPQDILRSLLVLGTWS
jgi:hypothetical protein